MLTFRTLLEDAGIDTARTRLVRHQDTNTKSGQTLFDIWIANDGRFDLYQKIQGKERFKGSDYIASFVATPLRETLFVGLYKVRGRIKAARGTIDPVSGKDCSGMSIYDLQPDPRLGEYAGRLIVGWGGGYRSWVQRAASKPKTILEIRRQIQDPPFPGFTEFTWRIRSLSSVPQSWRIALSAVSGVYLLVCHSDGKQYVGSACGAGGFWSRWESYFRNNHGGNEGMRLRKESDYEVSILEVASSSMSANDIVGLEAHWKDKLLSRKFGLNRN